MLVTALLIITFVSSSMFVQEIEQKRNIIFDLWVDDDGTSDISCGAIMSQPCKTFEDVLIHVETQEYRVHTRDGIYEFNMKLFDLFKESPFPTADIIAQETASIDLIGPTQPIGKIILSFQNFRMEIKDITFEVGDDKSSLKFTNCDIIRNNGITAINAFSLAAINHGSFILDQMTINGQNLIGNYPLIQATNPQQIQIISSHITNLTINTGNINPVILNVVQDQQYTKLNDGPIVLIDRSELIRNTLSAIPESSAIQIVGIRSSDIIIKNSIIDNRFPPNNNRHYEFKITLPTGSVIQDIVGQFQQIDFGITFYPVAVRVSPNTLFSTPLIPLSDAYMTYEVNNNGINQCTSYTANYRSGISTVGCAVIVMKGQDNIGLLKGKARIVLITGEFTESDLQTDGLNVSFQGTDSITRQNQIRLYPSSTSSTNLADNSLFRVSDSGSVALINLYILRLNYINSDNCPIAMIVGGSNQQSNQGQMNAEGQLVIQSCIFEGRNSRDTSIWINQGVSETCDVGYGAAIVADGQSSVQIIKTTIKSFEGPAVRAMNGAGVTIDSDTILDLNGIRFQNTLSSMQTNAVCEGGSGTSYIYIALDNTTSYLSQGNGWIFSQTGSSCTVRTTYNGVDVIPRSAPYTTNANIVVHNNIQQAEVTVNGRFLEPCMRQLVLEIYDQKKPEIKVTHQFGVGSSSTSMNAENQFSSDRVVLNIPSALLQDLDISSEWVVSVYESGRREQASWTTTRPTQDGEVPVVDTEDGKKVGLSSVAILVLSIIIPIVVFIVIIVLILLCVYCCLKGQSNDNKKRSPEEADDYNKETEVQMQTENEEDVKSMDQEQQQQIQQQNIKQVKAVGYREKAESSYFTESDIDQRRNIDQHNSNSGSNEHQREIQQEETSSDQEEIEQQQRIQNQRRLKQKISPQRGPSKANVNISTQKDEDDDDDEEYEQLQKIKPQKKKLQNPSNTESTKESTRRSTSTRASELETQSQSSASASSEQTRSASSYSEQSQTSSSSASSEDLIQKSDKTSKTSKSGKSSKQISTKDLKSNMKTFVVKDQSLKEKKDGNKDNLSSSQRKQYKDKQHNKDVEDDKDEEVIGEELLDDSKDSEVVKRISLDDWEVNESGAQQEEDVNQLITSKRNSKGKVNDKDKDKDKKKNKSKSNTKNDSGNESQSMQSSDINASKKKSIGSKAKLMKKSSSSKHTDTKDAQNSPRPDPYLEEEQSNEIEDSQTSSDDVSASSVSS
ncbi:MAG: hypothetical protein EZS28_020888, partial [Streblomastix strix]